MSESLLVLASRIRRAVTGHDFNVIAAVGLIAGSELLLRKVVGFVDSDGWIEWGDLANHVDVSGWSSGEKAAIRLACSLAGDMADGPGPRDGWNLALMLAPLNAELRRLAVEAVRYTVYGPEGTR